MDNVLIVEDDAQILMILCDTLSKYKNKFKVITAEDGLAAIKALQKKTFSLVVTDIRMPKINGIVLLAYMTKNFPKIPSIVMTSHGTPVLKKYLQEKNQKYFEKPFKVSNLAQAIMSILGQPERIGGTVTGISIIGFLKLIETEYITCLCEISSPEGKKGYLLFEEGVLHNALYGNIRGEKAVIQLFQIKGATIKLRTPPKGKFRRLIHNTLSHLAAQAMGFEDKTELP